MLAGARPARLACCAALAAVLLGCGAPVDGFAAPVPGGLAGTDSSTGGGQQDGSTGGSAGDSGGGGSTGGGSTGDSGGGGSTGGGSTGGGGGGSAGGGGGSTGGDNGNHPPGVRHDIPQVGNDLHQRTQWAERVRSSCDNVGLAPDCLTLAYEYTASRPGGETESISDPGDSYDDEVYGDCLVTNVDPDSGNGVTVPAGTTIRVEIVCASPEPEPEPEPEPTTEAPDQ